MFRPTIPGGRQALISKTCSALRSYPVMVKASLVNLEEKPGVGDPKAVHNCTLAAGHSYDVIGPICLRHSRSFGPISVVDGGTCCVGDILSSILHCPGLHPKHHIYPLYHQTWRGHSTFAPSVGTHHGRRTSVTGYKSLLN